MNCFRNCCTHIMVQLKETLNSVGGEDNRARIGNHHMFYRCVDSPYGLISFELLIEIRNKIESIRNPVFKRYYRYLEEFMTILDNLCQENSRRLYMSYVRSLSNSVSLESDLSFKKMLNLTLKAIQLGIEKVYTKNQLLNLKKKINLLQEEIFKFHLDNQSCEILVNYSKILYKLPKLALVRRGYDLNSISFVAF